VALRKLIADGVLIRLGEGVYAKASRAEHGNSVLAAEPQVIIEEVLRKLDVKPESVCIEEGPRKRVIVDSLDRKIDRHLAIGDLQVDIVTSTAMAKADFLPQDAGSFPRRNVGKYIAVLARRHRISPRRNGLDRWTEAVSRAAGDSVELDTVGRFLAKLRQQHVISGKQMAHLMNNYMTEREEAQHVV